MTTKEKTAVSETLSEGTKKIKVGLFTFKARPLTLAQIYEMGAVANDINADGLESKERVYVMAELIEHHRDARLLIETFIICVFRKRWKRRLFGWYIRNRLTIAMFQELMVYISQSFNANFFLTSIIFLRQTKAVTEPKKTTAPGLLSEE